MAGISHQKDCNMHDPNFGCLTWQQCKDKTIAYPMYEESAGASGLKAPSGGGEIPARWRLQPGL